MVFSGEDFTTRLMNDMDPQLLDLVKTRESYFELADLHGLIDKMILLVSPQSNAKKIKVSRQFDPDIMQVWMDTEKMKQVILNLLSNAVDFTPKGGKIELLTKNYTDRGKPEVVQIEIKDNGTGIPPSYINKVFDPYFTTKSKSDIHKGAGLGLFIAHQNILDHGGTIEVKSKVDEGSVFTLTLPANQSKQSSHKN